LVSLKVSGRVDGHIGVEALADGCHGGERRGDLKGDARQDQLLAAIAAMAWATMGSSNALTDERSIIGTSGRASTSSGKVGPPHAVARGGGDDYRQSQGLGRFGQRHHIVLQLSRRVVADPGHEADLMVYEASAAFSDVSGS
jgi:hypothetical protein